MPFIWNDSTFFERIRKSHKQEKIFFFPPLIVSFLFWYFYTGEELNLIKVFLISLVTASTFYTFISLVLKLPNYKIPDNYHPYAKTAMRCAIFLANLFAFYVMLHLIIKA